MALHWPGHLSLNSLYSCFEPNFQLGDGDNSLANKGLELLLNVIEPHGSYSLRIDKINVWLLLSRHIKNTMSSSFSSFDSFSQVPGYKSWNKLKHTFLY